MGKNYGKKYKISEKEAAKIAAANKKWLKIPSSNPTPVDHPWKAGRGILRGRTQPQGN